MSCVAFGQHNYPECESSNAEPWWKKQKRNKGANIPSGDDAFISGWRL